MSVTCDLNRAIALTAQLMGEGARDAVVRRFTPHDFMKVREVINDDHVLSLSVTQARDQLRSWVTALSRPDLTKLDPSWIWRCLRDEPQSIQVVAIQSLPVDCRDHVAKALSLDSRNLAHLEDDQRDPWSRVFAENFWKERLIGGHIDPSTSPPVLVCLDRMNAEQIQAGLRRIFMDQQMLLWNDCTDSAAILAEERLGARIDREWLSHHWAQHGPGQEDEVVYGRSMRARLMIHFSQQKRIESEHDRQLELAACWGAMGLGELLRDLEVHRYRWAVQRLPYDLSRFVRLGSNGSGQVLSGDSRSRIHPSHPGREARLLAALQSVIPDRT